MTQLNQDSSREQMRAIRCDERGDLSLEILPAPSLPQESEYPLALVKIQAFGINRADLLQRAGHYPPPSGVRADLLGLEFTGVIEEVLDSSSDAKRRATPRLSVGDRVMGICAGGAYAERLITPLDQLLPVPPNFTIPEAAALPEAYLTAFDALTTQAKLCSGERVLIHAIGSGVGAAAAHLASHLGAEVFGTTRSEWKQIRALEELPVQEVWRSRDGRWSPERFDPFQVVIDFIGAAYLQENLSALSLKGRLVIVGLLGGVRGELHLGALLSKRAQIIGTVLRSRSTQEKIELTQRFREEVLDSFVDQVLPPPSISEIFAAEDILRAHELLASNQTWSKLVCVWDD